MTFEERLQAEEKFIERRQELILGRGLRFGDYVRIYDWDGNEEFGILSSALVVVQFRYQVTREDGSQSDWFPMCKKINKKEINS